MLGGRRLAIVLPAKGPQMTPDGVMQLRVRRLRESARLPHRASDGATGLDIYASLESDLELGPAPIIVPAGIAIEFPAGYDVQVRPRSGLSSKGVGVAFGTIDSDYRGELLVTMWTFGGRDRYLLHDGDRIAQLVVARLAPLAIVEVETLSPTPRGEGGHGSTGR